MGNSCIQSKKQNISEHILLKPIPKLYLQNIQQVSPNMSIEQFQEIQSILEQSCIQNQQFNKFWQYILNNEQNTDKQYQNFQFYCQFSICYALLYGLIYTIQNYKGETIGVSFMFPPGQIKIGNKYTKSRICKTQWKMYNDYKCKININTNKNTKLKMNEYNELIQQKQKQYMPDSHWYLQNISILPQYQNQDYQTQFINLFKYFVERDNKTGYLEINDQSDRKLFQQNGFKVIDKLILNIEDQPELGIYNNDGGTSIMIIHPQQYRDSQCNTGVMSQDDFMKF